MSQKRAPRGIPTGGQWVADERGEPRGVALGSDTTKNCYSCGNAIDSPRGNYGQCRECARTYEPEASFDTVVAYTYKADQYTPAGLIEAMIADGQASPGARGMSAEDVLDQIAEANALDRYDEHTFDSDEFPKAIFANQLRDSDYGAVVNEFGEHANIAGHHGGGDW